MNDRLRENLIHVLYEQAEIELNNSDYCKALHTLGQLTDLMKDYPAHYLHGGVKRLYALIYKYQGKFYPALNVVKEGIEIYKQRNELWQVLQMHNLKGDIYFQFCKYSEAIAEWERALNVNCCTGEDPDKAFVKAQIFLKLGKTFVMITESKLARSNYVKGFYYSRMIEDKSLICQCQAGLATTYHLENRFELALQIYYRTLKLARKEDEQLLIGRLLHCIGDIYTKLGDFERALKVYQESLEITERNQDFLYSAGTLRELGRLHLKDDSDKTITFCEKSVDKLIENITTETRGECERLLGKAFYLMALYYYRHNQNKQAMMNLVEAGEIFQRYSMVKEQKRAETLYRDLTGHSHLGLPSVKANTLSVKLGIGTMHVQASSS